MTIVKRYWIGDLELTEYPFGVARGDDTVDLGQAVNEMIEIASALQDGEIVTSPHTSNREIVAPVYVQGTDLLELAQNEALLKRACENQRNTFTVDPGDTYGNLTVFDTFRIQPSRRTDDVHESALMHRWDLTIPALPWARSANPTTVMFEPTAGDLDELDDCSTVDDWTVQSRSTAADIEPSTYAGDDAVLISIPASDDKRSGFSAVWSGTVPAAQYLVLEFASDVVRPSEVALNNVAPVSSLVIEAGKQRLVFPNPGAGPLRFEFVFAPGSLIGKTGEQLAPDQYLIDLSSSDVMPLASVLVADVGGSVRTPGAVKITHPSVSMNELIVFSDPALLTYGYDPSLPETWAAAPEGTYTVFVRNETVIDVGEIVTVAIGGQTCTTRVPQSASDGGAKTCWVIVGDVSLGGTRDGLVGDVTATVTVDGTPTTCDVWIFRRWSPGEGAETTALTYIKGEFTGPALIDIPSLQAPQGGVWIEGGVDALDITMAWEPPTLNPPQAALFVSDLGGPAAGLVVELTYFKRWDGYAVD